MGSRTKHQPVKPYKNPNQRSPHKAGVVTWTPPSTRYRPVTSSLQGTDTVPDSSSSGWREDSSAAPHWETAALKPPRSLAQLSRGGAEGRLSTQTCVVWGFMVWKTTFSTCCPRNRRSSMSLEVSAGVLAAHHRPGAELGVWGRESLAEEGTM